MVDVAVYVEFKAKSLIKELSENFDIRKCGDLYQTLGDLLKLESEAEFKKSGFVVPNGGPLPDAIVDALTPVLKKDPEPSPKKERKVRGPYLKHGERQAIIDLILYRFYEESKSGKTEFAFYGKDFGVSGEYLQKNIFNTLNINPTKEKRFPDLKIRYMAIPGGVSCHIGRKEGR